MGRKRDSVNTESMYEEYLAGHSLERIGKDWGVSRQTVFERFTRAGLSLRPRARPKPYIKHGGRRFTVSKGGYLRATAGDRAFLHRVVWEEHHGPIPPGHEVRHRDGDLTNNDPENLQLVDLRARMRAQNPRRAVEVRACLACGAPIHRHDHEGPSAYRKRMFCGCACRGLWLRGGRKGPALRRHSWEILERLGHGGSPYKWRCRSCGLVKLKRPHPYARQWFTEWTWPDGRAEVAEKTPPCGGEASDGER